MYFNYSAEKQKLVGTWERLAKEYAAAGMSEEAIAQMKEYDMQWMRSRRRYAVHNIPLLDSPGPGEDDAPIHFLFNLPAKPELFHSSERLGWLDEIEDEQLYKRLRKLKRKDLEVLTLVVLEGYTQADVAKMTHVAPSTICVRMKRIKAFLRGEKGGGRKRRNASEASQSNSM